MKVPHIVICGIGAVALVLAVAACSQPTNSDPDPDPAPVTLTSITAAYDDSHNTIFPDTGLQTLKDDLTVKAHYSNGSTVTLALDDYELNGTLTVGSSTITVTYKGKTATFAVTVADSAGHTHSWSGWMQTLAPTCTHEGERERHCSNAPAHDDREAVAINPNAHQYAWDVTTSVSATDDGVETQICQHNNAHHGSTQTYAYAYGTAGLEFTLIEGGTNNGTYRLRKGTVTSGAVYIPAWHHPNVNASNPSNFTYPPLSDYKLVTEIGSSTDGLNTGVFYNTAITTVSFTAGSQLTTIGYAAFLNCGSLISISTIPATVTSIGDNAFRGSTITTVIFAEGIHIEKISNYMFMDCAYLTTVTIPASVTAIGDFAFESCRSLPSLTIPEGVTSIGQRAFYNCTALGSLTIPAGVTAVGEAAIAWMRPTTIYIEGHANQSSADAAWGTSWRSYCNSSISYRG